MLADRAPCRAFHVTYTSVGCCNLLESRTTLLSQFSKMYSRMLAPGEGFMSGEYAHYKHEERQGSFVLIALISYSAWINSLHNIMWMKEK